MSGETRLLTVPDGLIGQRADAALARLLGMSRTKTAELLDHGNVLANGKVIVRSEKLSAGALLDITIPQTRTAPADIVVAGMRIIHADDDVIVVDKPAGIAAHPATGWDGPSVIGSLRASGYRLTSLGPTEREGIVHRLDVGTSGVMVLARSYLAYRELKRSFKYREVSKKYRALVQGEVTPPVGTIDAPIGHAGTGQWKMAIRDNGKAAITHYDVIETLPGASLVDIDLATGRTHQIRVHFAAIGHPLLGDLTYGANPKTAERVQLTRQWLHAYQLSFSHPSTGQEVTFTSNPTEDLVVALQTLRRWETLDD